MKKGFTLIELLAVIVVIAIITVVAVPIITGVINKTKINALKQSAEGLIDASRLYNAQYANESTVRFDISNNVITSEDTDKMLKYKGSIKGGTVIIDTKGRSVICVTDGNRSAYKNYSENVVSISNNETCSIPSGSSIVYLGNEATITELSNQELTQQLQQLQSEIATLKSKPSDATPIGTVISKMGASIPEGYLSCDGSYYDIDGTYSALAEYIKEEFGSYDYFKIGSEEVPSGKFKVPDLRGEFLRGTGNNGHSNQGNGASVGVHQDATEHVPLHSSSGVTYYVAESTDDYPSNEDSYTRLSRSQRRFSYGTATSGGNQASFITSRPTNTSVLYLIKY